MHPFLSGAFHGGWLNGQRDGRTDGRTDGRIDGRTMDRRANERTDGQTPDGRTNGRMDGRWTDVHTHITPFNSFETVETAFFSNIEQYFANNNFQKKHKPSFNDLFTSQRV